MELFNRRETAAILGVSLTTLDKMRENKKIGYYQSCPGGKVQFTRKHIEQYWERIESEPREKYARKTDFLMEWAVAECQILQRPFFCAQILFSDGGRSFEIQSEEQTIAHYP